MSHLPMGAEALPWVVGPARSCRPSPPLFPQAAATQDVGLLHAR